MIDVGGLSGELADLAKIIGLLKDDGAFNAAWFNDPLVSLRTVLSNPPQRRALLRLLDALLPPRRGPGVPEGEKWHPLLNANAVGNVYLTVREADAGVVIGVAGDFGTDGPPVAARIGIVVPLIAAGSTVTLLPGTDAGPLVARLSVVVNLVRGAGVGISLRAVNVEVQVRPPKVAMRLVLEGLSLDGEPPVDKLLDPATLGADVPDLLAGLLKQIVAQNPVAAAAVQDAVGLLGLAENEIPAFPFVHAAQNPAAVQGWLASLFEGGAPPIEAWLRHFAGLFRALFPAAPAVERIAATESFSIPLIPLGSPTSQLRLAVARSNGKLRIGLALRLSDLIGGVRFGLEAGASLADIPLAGSARAQVLPEAFAHLRINGNGDTRLVPLGEATSVVPANNDLRVGAVVAGLRFDGAALQPRLELQGVRFLGTSYPVLDLTHTDSVATAASGLITAAIDAALGNGGVATHLAALAGLAPPRDPGNPAQPLPGWPHRINAERLLTDPAGAFAEVHRAVLRDAAFGWNRLLAELVALLPGVPAAITGTGSSVDPWRATLGNTGALQLQLVAYDAQADAAPAATRQLRLGLRLAAEAAPLQFAFTSDLLAFDLPASGPGNVGLLGAQRLRLSLAPAFDGKLFDAAVSARVDAFFAELRWAPGDALAWQAGISNLRIDAAGDVITVASIALPAIAGFDLANPAAAAALFGLTPATLERLTALLIAQAASALPGPARDLTALLGLHRFGSSLPIDWPQWADAAAPGLSLSDPLAALRGWLQRLLTTAAVDGRPHLVRWVAGLTAALGPQLEATLGTERPAIDPLAQLQLEGAGTFDEPWSLPLPGAAATDAAQVLVWLDPAGPPTALATGINSWLGSAASFSEAVAALRALALYDETLRARLRGRDTASVAEALDLLADLLERSDGVVPQASQQPQIDGWLLPDPVTATHWNLPQAAAAIAEIGTRVDAIAGGAGAARVVLLLAPRLAGVDPWAALLGAATTHGTKNPAALFALDDASIPNPLTFPLDGVTAVADWYVARLPDDDIPDWTRQSQLIAHVSDRLAQLRPGVKLTLVAHSTLGLAARHYAANHVARVAGLVTLGTPHIGANLPFLTDPDLADAIRLIGALAADLSDASLRAAIGDLCVAIDGYRPGASAASLPTRQPFPFAAFDPTGADIDLAGLPVIAIGATVHSDGLLAELKTASQALATRIAASVRPAPTHLGVGVAIALDLGSSTDIDLAAQAHVRVDLLQIPLTAVPAAAPRPVNGLRFTARLFRRNGWLLGGASTLPAQLGGVDPRLAFIDVRLRELTIALDAVRDGGTIRAQPSLLLTDAALHGPTLPVLRAGDAITAGVLGELFQALSAGADLLGGSTSRLLDALTTLGLVGPDPHGGIGLLDDAWRALQADAMGFLGQRLPPLFESGAGWLGFAGPPAGPWVWAPGDVPIDLVVTREGTVGPWSAAVRMRAETAPDEAALGVGVSVGITLPALAVTAGVSARLGAFELNWQNGTLIARAEPWLAGLTLLPPPTPADLQRELSKLWPRLLFSGAASAALRAVAPTLRLTGFERLLSDAGGFLQETLALGDGTGFSVERVRGLIRLLSRALGLPSDGTLALPANLRLSADGAGTAADPLRLALDSTAPLAGVLSFALGVAIDPARHVTPQGGLTLTLPLPAGSTWGQLGLRFGAATSGLSLQLLPGNGVAPIQILPTFSGLGTLRGAIEALLPRVLDELVRALGPPPPWLTNALSVANAFDLHDNAGGFAAHTAQLRALLDGTAFTFDTAKREAIAQAAVTLLQTFGGLPVTVARDGARVRLGVRLPVQLAGTVGIAVGFEGAIPSFGLFVDNLQLAGVVQARLTLLARSDGVSVEGRIGASFATIGVPVVPRIDFSGDTAAGGFRLSVRPLAAGIGDADAGPLQLQLAPTFAATLAANSIERLLSDWALPLVAGTLIQVARNEGLLTTALWSSGPTLEAVLTQSGLVTGSGVTLRLASPIPGMDRLVFGAIKALATGVEIPIGELRLALVNEAGRLGLGLSGQQKFNLGKIQIAVLFGAPQSWTQTVGGDAGTPEVADGLQVFVLRDDGSTLSVDVGIELSGVGVGIFGSDGRALLDDPSVRIGGVSAMLFMNIETKSGPAVQRLGGGLLIKEFGLPLGALTGGGSGGGNPVVSALLSQGGSGGDARTPAPTTDLEVWFREDDRLHLRMGGESKALWIGVHSQFGPIYIDQVGVRLTSTDAGLLVDGGVSLAGFSAQVDDLSLIVPFRTAGDPATWKLDLKGLGLGFSQPGITIAGALVKYEPPIEYNGMLLIKIGSIGAIAVGSYSVPVDDNGDKFTSLAIFGGVFVPIGLTPIINITALGLGLGLNRRLIVPDDLNQIPNFFLIQALDRPALIANDPLGALLRFRAAVPARRGSFWIAAGLRGTSFEIVHVTAVLYVALDRGVEVGLLGLARAALPADEAALVSVELALKVRFSTAEMLFSVQAQLTDNSWLLSHDCQLTGGFAFFMWFKKSQFLLTLGGYHPSFQKLPEYPDVPRLGYRWNLLGVVHIKGESYFALTNTCVMAGTLLEVTYGPDWLQLWFTAHADFLAQWDPFYFVADVGVAVGARLRVEVCFIGCVTISISVSVGATLHLEGPPLHGTVTVDLAVTTVTVPFGPNVRPKPPPIDWEAFKLKFLKASDPATLPVGVQISTGLLAPEPPGAPVAPGTEAQPWKLAAEWVFQSETRMPARSFAFVQDGVAVPWNPNGAARFGRFSMEAQTYDLDIGPMNAEDVTSCHRVFIDKRVGTTWQRITAAELDADRFAIKPRLGEVSEAAYRVFADLPPAAANTLPALLGLVVHGIAELRSTTPDVIPIAKLRDATNPRPLPFARRDALIFAEVQIAGRAADRYLAIGDTLSYKDSLLAAATVLSGNTGVFAENRVASGVFGGGLGPVATRSLLERRSAAPLVAPLSTGLSMKPVDQDIAPTALRPEAAAPVDLEQPRLRAVLQAQARATEASPPTIRTTVSKEQRSSALATIVVGRDLKRGVAVAGARLEFQAAARAPAPTRFANAATSVRSPQVGGASGVPRTKAFALAEKAAQGDGAIVRSGVTQLWDVPMAQPAIALSGDQAVRVTLLSRGGGVLSDAEHATGEDLRIVLPDTCAAVAVTGLGRLGAARDGWRIPPGPGAVTAFAAPAGRTPATGWQSSDLGVQLNATTLLVRGAVLSLSEPAQVALHGQSLTQAVVPLAQAIGIDAAVEMRLSARITVLAVMLDAVSQRLPGDDDLMLSLHNASIDARPVRAGGGQRAVLLFDVHADPKATVNGDVPIIVGAHAATDVRISGMVGLGGTAREWGERLNGGLPEDWVPDEALTPDGATRVRFVGSVQPAPEPA